MLGYPRPMQYSVAWECESSRMKPGAIDREALIRKGVEEWRLLLQVDWDENAGIEWIAAGRAYYMMRQQDLESGIFNHVCYVLQCT